MTPHVMTGGTLRAPFVYPVALADRLAQRYVEDRARTQPLPWFARDPAAPVFLMGADSFGRDLLSRLLHGARVSLSLALAAVLGTLVLGAVIGAAAGYRGGWIDEAAMRAADFVMVLPVIYVVLVLRAVMPLVLPATTVFAADDRHLRARRVAVCRPWRARSRPRRTRAGIHRRGAVAGREPLAHHAAPPAARVRRHRCWSRRPCSCRHSFSPRPPCRTSGSAFPSSVPTWGTMLSEAANVSAIARFPWTLAPAVAIFLVVLASNVILQSDKIDPTVAGPRPTSSNADTARFARSEQAVHK